MDTINEIANPKGWEYIKRKGKIERRFGFKFVSINAPDGENYTSRIRANNPVDAANRLSDLSDCIRQFPQLQKKHPEEEVYDESIRRSDENILR